MQSEETDKTLRCEQCGAPLPSRLGEGGCLQCMLRGGMDADEAEVALSPMDFGTRFYQHYQVLIRPDGSPWELGRGAMGVTYKAVDVNLRVPVALKVINGRLSSQPGAHRRFLQEAQAAAQLRHPNVASVFHFGVVNALPAVGSTDEKIESGDCFYAMEFVEGETLEARLRRKGPLTPVVALEIGVQVARALAAAEKHRLVHRDLKPSNIMLLAEEDDRPHGKSTEAWVKVIDFGLAKAVSEEDEPASSLQFRGTPQFSSPEQMRGEAIDVRSDIYSLGATLWYALTGKVPFPKAASIQSRDGKGSPALPLTELNERGVPSPVGRLLASMLAAVPRRRPASAVSLGEALQECLEAISENRLTAARSSLGGGRRRAAMAALSLAAVLAALAFYLLLPASLPSDKSIAVLPFKNLSTDPRNAFFVDGFEDDLLSNLVKIRDLKVIGRLSTARYSAGAQRDLRAIGRELGVRHILEGSLRRTGDRVLLQVALLDTSDGHALWAERYDRTMADAISLQGELAGAIVDALDARLSPQEKVDIHSKATLNPSAYLLYLRGRKFENGATNQISDYEASEAFYRQALAFDPSFALAHARLATRLAMLYRFREPTKELKQRAHAEAQEALRLQPDLGEGHLAKALCFYFIERDFGRALPEFGIAQRLLPNDPEPDSYLAYIHRRQGKWCDARAGLERVISRDPRNMNYEEELYATFCLLRDWPSAARHIERAAVIAPEVRAVKIERTYLDFWWHDDLRPMRKFFADYKSYGDQEGNIAWARWDSAMLDRDFARAQAAVDGFPYETMPSVFSAALPKSYLKGCIKLAQGDNVGAQKLFENARPSMEAEALAHKRDGLRHARLGLLYAYMGNKAAAIREGERAVQLQPRSRDAYDGPQRLANLALIHARVGDIDQAITMIQSLLQAPGCVSVYEASISLSDLRLRWQWDPLRKDPRFQKILAGPEPATAY
ncbi:MAG TPA: protein kinase [Chthoniobacterales bacterium]